MSTVGLAGYGCHKRTIDFLEPKLSLQDLNQGEIEKAACGVDGLVAQYWISVEGGKERSDERTMLPGLLMTMNSRS